MGDIFAAFLAICNVQSDTFSYKQKNDQYIKLNHKNVYAILFFRKCWHVNVPCGILIYIEKYHLYTSHLNTKFYTYLTPNQDARPPWQILIWLDDSALDHQMQTEIDSII